MKRLSPVLLAAPLVVAALAGCSRPAPPIEAPRYVLGVSVGPEFTVLGATFTPPAAVAWRQGPCTATVLQAGREPASLEVQRIDYWVVAGAPVGSARRRPDGTYQAAVRGTLAQGTRLAAEIVGGQEVPDHRWRTPARVPSRVRRTAPAAGFALRVGEPLALAWEGGDSSHVALSVTVDAGGPEASDGWLVSCVVSRGPGRFVVPAAAFAQPGVPATARVATVALVAADRAQEGEYALDVSPLAVDDDLVRGTLSRP